MRIELPIPSWSDTVLRAEEDAHTLTVPPAGDWVAAARALAGGEGHRVEIPETPMVVLTLTL